MSTLIDDDFQSYTVGANPPYGNLYQYSGVSTIATTIPGIFGDTKEVTMPSGQDLLFPVPFSSLSNLLPVYNQFSVYMGLYIQTNNQSSAGALVEFNCNSSPYAGNQVACINVYNDGTVGVASGPGAIPYKISDYAFKQGGWHMVRVDILFSTSGSVVNVNVQVYVDGALWLTYNGPTIVPVASLAGLYVNNVIFGGVGGGSFLGRLTMYDTIQASNFWPHPGTPIAQITQGVIELILSAASPDIVAACPVVNTGVVGVPLSLQLLVTDTTGTPPDTWVNTTGAFPTGMTLNATTGLISGTPTVGGTFNWTVTVTNFQGDTSDPISCTTTINIAITCPPATTANIFEPYSSNSGISGQTNPVTWSITSGSLPTGLTLNTSTGNIQGTPTALGAFTFNLHVVDTNGATGDNQCTITVVAVRPARLCTTL